MRWTKHFFLCFALLVSSSLASKEPLFSSSLLQKALAHAKGLSFETSDRLAITIPFNGGKWGALEIDYPLGGFGAGVSYEPLETKERATITLRPPGVSIVTGQLISSAVFEFLKQLRGKFVEDLNEDKDMSLFGVLGKVLDLEVTPGRLFLIKMMLLLKHYVEHGADVIKYTLEYRFPFSYYLTQLGILLVRFSHTFKTGVGAARSFGERLPNVVRELLKDASRALIEIMEISDATELFLEQKLEEVWQIVMGAGITFDDDGALRNSGLRISGISCDTEEQAKDLEQFLTQTIATVRSVAQAGGTANWGYLERRFYGQSFKVIVGKIVRAMEVRAGLSDEQQRQVQAARIVYDAVSDRIIDFPQRYDPFNPSQHPLTQKNTRFVGVLGEYLSDGKLAEPVLFRIGTHIFYVTSQLGVVDGLKIASIIFFRVMHDYIGAMNDSAVRAKISQLVEQRELERKYLFDYPEGRVSGAYVEGVVSGAAFDTRVVEVSQAWEKNEITPALGLSKERLDKLQMRRKQVAWDVADLYSQLRIRLFRAAGLNVEKIPLGPRPGGALFGKEESGVVQGYAVEAAPVPSAPVVDEQNQGSVVLSGDEREEPVSSAPTALVLNEQDDFIKVIPTVADANQSDVDVATGEEHLDHEVVTEVSAQDGVEQELQMQEDDEEHESSKVRHQEENMQNASGKILDEQERIKLIRAIHDARLAKLRENKRIMESALAVKKRAKQQVETENAGVISWLTSFISDNGSGFAFESIERDINDFTEKIEGYNQSISMLEKSNVSILPSDESHIFVPIEMAYRVGDLNNEGLSYVIGNITRFVERVDSVKTCRVVLNRLLTELRAKNDGAEKIQRVWRGHKGRQVVEELRKERRENAATTIQSIVRMQSAKNERRRRADAAGVMQRVAKKS